MKTLAEQRRDRAIKMYQEGSTLTQIQLATGYSATGFYRMLDRFGVPLRSSGETLPPEVTQLAKYLGITDREATKLFRLGRSRLTADILRQAKISMADIQTLCEHLPKDAELALFPNPKIILYGEEYPLTWSDFVKAAKAPIRWIHEEVTPLLKKEV
jgi:hypothetical protein